LDLIKLGGLPNAFPSLHLATALLMVQFARGKFWRGLSLVFLGATALATLTTGEHYVIDLVVAVPFACFAWAIAHRRGGAALVHLGVVAGWAIVIRLGAPWLVGYPYAVQALALLTVGAGARTVLKAWTVGARPPEHVAELEAVGAR
jgi:hypothetical protein